MLDPRELYEVVGDVPELGRPAMVVVLTGFVDAGSAGRLAREHLLATLESRELVRFDLDALLDYRSRRPLMTFAEDHWEGYERPSLAIHLLHDRANTPFLLLAGLEPDLLWERFCAAVIELVERLGVRLTVNLNAIPMAVPHTRPIGLTAHATRRELIAGYEPWLRKVQVPGSAAQLLEYLLGQSGKEAMGFAAHVPHYLAQSEYPAAAEQLLLALSRATGLLLPIDQLSEAAKVARAEIDQQLARASEAASAVRSLEEQYDAFVLNRLASGRLAPWPLPTGEELGAELERFLAEQTRPGEQPPPNV